MSQKDWSRYERGQVLPRRDRFLTIKRVTGVSPSAILRAYLAAAKPARSSAPAQAFGFRPGTKESRNFDRALRRVLTVSKEEIDRRVAAAKGDRDFQRATGELGRRPGPKPKGPGKV